MAQLYTKSHEVIALRHCYSGSSLLTMNITGHQKWRLGGSLVPGIKHAHNAYCFRCAFGREYPDCDLECAKDVKELIETTTSGQPAAFIAEPIQGVGGFITPPKEYFREVVSIVKRYGGLFICDEVQTGWGRTGGRCSGSNTGGWSRTSWSWQKERPMAPLLGSPLRRQRWQMVLRVPISPPLVEILSQRQLSLLLSKSLRKEDWFRMPSRWVNYLRDRLEGLKEKFQIIGEVRGMGLIQGMEIVKEEEGTCSGSGQ